jgi:hypothetical protein
MMFKGVLQLTATFVFGLLLAALFFAAGAISAATTPFILLGIIHLLGYISLGLLEAVVLFFVAVGGVLGLLAGVGGLLGATA